MSARSAKPKLFFLFFLSLNMRARIYYNAALLLFFQFSRTPYYYCYYRQVVICIYINWSLTTARVRPKPVILFRKIYP